METFFLILLIAAFLGITAMAGLVVAKLFQGQQ